MIFKRIISYFSSKLWIIPLRWQYLGQWELVWDPPTRTWWRDGAIAGRTRLATPGGEKRGEMKSFLGQSSVFLLVLLTCQSVRAQCDPVFEDCSGGAEVEEEVRPAGKHPDISVFLSSGRVWRGIWGLWDSGSSSLLQYQWCGHRYLHSWYQASCQGMRPRRLFRTRWPRLRLCSHLDV